MDGNDSRKSPELDSTEEENAKKPIMLFGREFSRKQVCAAGAGILCAALLIGCEELIHERGVFPTGDLGGADNVWVFTE